MRNVIFGSHAAHTLRHVSVGFLRMVMNDSFSERWQTDNIEYCTHMYFPAQILRPAAAYRGWLSHTAPTALANDWRLRISTCLLLRVIWHPVGGSVFYMTEWTSDSELPGTACVKVDATLWVCLLCVGSAVTALSPSLHRLPFPMCQQGNIRNIYKESFHDTAAILDGAAVSGRQSGSVSGKYMVYSISLAKVHIPAMVGCSFHLSWLWLYSSHTAARDKLLIESPTSSTLKSRRASLIWWSYQALKVSSSTYCTVELYMSSTDQRSRTI